jgi:hypothetical protein
MILERMMTSRSNNGPERTQKSNAGEWSKPRTWEREWVAHLISNRMVDEG